MTEIAPPKKRSNLGLLLGFFILSSVASAAYVSWKNITTDNLMDSYNESLVNQERALKKLMENEQVGEKTNAKNILNRANNYRVEWSTIAEKVLTEIDGEEIELDRVSSTSNLYFTATGKAKDLRSIARLIAKMRQSENFDQPFVSGFTQNGTSDRPYSFNLNFYYQESK